MSKNVMKELGWDESLQAEILHVVKNTREVLQHTIVGMRQRVFPEELFIQVVDRYNTVPKIIARSTCDIEDKDHLHELYDRLIRQLGLPYCCLVHKERFDPEEPEFEFVTDDDPDDFEFIEPDPDEDGFDLGSDDTGFDLSSDDDDLFTLD